MKVFAKNGNTLIHCFVFNAEQGFFEYWDMTKLINRHKSYPHRISSFHSNFCYYTDTEC